VGAREHRVGAGVGAVRRRHRDKQPAGQHAALGRRGGDADRGAGDDEGALQ
jgi:hypothetical protein